MYTLPNFNVLCNAFTAAGGVYAFNAALTPGRREIYAWYPATLTDTLGLGMYFLVPLGTPLKYYSAVGNGCDVIVADPFGRALLYLPQDVTYSGFGHANDHLMVWAWPLTAGLLAQTTNPWGVAANPCPLPA